jgi:tetratricopeptide (TPR) repeat protein
MVNPKADIVAVKSKYVHDEQGVLGPFVQTLDRVAKDWRNTLGIEVQVVIIHQTGSSINELTNDLFQIMNIGNGYETGGLLIVINSASNEARIEVTGSLEGVFTDAMIGLLAHNQLAPYASYNALGMAVMDVLHYLKDHALISALNGEMQLSQKFKNSEGYKTKKQFYSTGGGAKVAIPDVPSDVNFKKRVSNDTIHKYLPGESPEESVIAFKNSIRDYIGDPDLELFTESSMEMRRRYPFSVYEELARLERIESSEPLVIHHSGNYAVAMSDNPAHGYVPILMRRVDGTWRIDQSETWKSLFFNKEGNYELHNNSTPYYFALSALGKGKEYDVLPLPVPRGELQQLLSDLQSKNDALSKFKLAELLFRNVFVSIEALSYYEQAVMLAPNDPLFLETYADRAMYLGFSDLAIPLYRRLGKTNVIDLARAYVSSDKLDMAEVALRDMLASNPYHLESLRWLKWVLEKKSDSEASSINQKLNQIYRDDNKPGNSVILEFWPKRPLFNSSKTTYISKKEIFGYSNFSIIMNNTSNRNVVIDRVIMDSHGTGPSSGLGDIKNYWKYPGGQYRLAPGGTVSLHNNNWGFTVDPAHQRLSYTFEICWHAEDSAESQCNYQRLNLASDQNVLWTTQGFDEGAELDGLWFASNDAEHFNAVHIEQSGNAINMYIKQSMSLDGSGAITNGNLFRGVLSDSAISGKLSLRNINEINNACVEPMEEWRDMTFRFLGDRNRMMGILDIPVSAVNQQISCVLDSDYTHYYYLEKL